MLPVDIHGIAEQKQAALGISNFRSQPVPCSIGGPRRAQGRIRSGDGLRRKSRHFSAVDEDMDRGALACSHMHFESYGFAWMCRKCATHFCSRIRSVRAEVEQTIA